MDQVLSKDTLPALRDRLWWSLLWLLLGSCALGLLSLLYAVGPYGLPVFLSYLRHPWIVFLNLAPVVVLTLFLFCLYGRPWPAFLTASVIVLGFSFGDYYMLKLRDDPLMFQDLGSLKEGLAVSAREHYDLWPDRRQIVGVLCVLAGVLFLRFLARGRLRWRFRRRLALALVPMALLVGLFQLCQNETLYSVKTVNNDAVNQWGATQVYLSRGFVYPFLHSVTANRMEKPSGYRDADALAALREYEDADIPADRKVSVVTLQLEAFSDLSRYGDLAGTATAPDEVLFPDIFALYQDAAADGSPVFSFNVSYQGHGPYSDQEVYRGLHFTDGRFSQESANILDNYLGSVQNTAENLRTLLDSFDTRPEPVVVVVYGDHKPWLGNNGSVYAELGIPLDTSDASGLFGKYSTDYLLWGNAAARALLGEDAFSGEGETISPNFLMNLVFDRLGWQGNAWAQFTDSVRQKMPVITTIGRFAWQGQYLPESDLPQEAQDLLNRYRQVQYYYENRAKPD